MATHTNLILFKCNFTPVLSIKFKSGMHVFLTVCMCQVIKLKSEQCQQPIKHGLSIETHRGLLPKRTKAY